jgi:hypothetical protein
MEVKIYALSEVLGIMRKINETYSSIILFFISVAHCHYVLHIGWIDVSCFQNLCGYYQVDGAGYERQAVADHANNLATRIRGNLTNSMKALGVDILTGVGTIMVGMNGNS